VVEGFAKRQFKRGEVCPETMNSSKGRSGQDRKRGDLGRIQSGFGGPTRREWKMKKLDYFERRNKPEGEAII